MKTENSRNTQSAKTNTLVCCSVCLQLVNQDSATLEADEQPVCDTCRAERESCGCCD